MNKTVIRKRLCNICRSKELAIKNARKSAFSEAQSKKRKGKDTEQKQYGLSARRRGRVENPSHTPAALSRKSSDESVVYIGSFDNTVYYPIVDLTNSSTSLLAEGRKPKIQISYNKSILQVKENQAPCTETQAKPATIYEVNKASSSRRQINVAKPSLLTPARGKRPKTKPPTKNLETLNKSLASPNKKLLVPHFDASAGDSVDVLDGVLQLEETYQNYADRCLDEARLDHLQMDDEVTIEHLIKIYGVKSDDTFH